MNDIIRIEAHQGSRGYPTREELQDLFFYDAETGKLYNKSNRGRAIAGVEAGTIHCATDGSAYRRVKINGEKYFSHILIWIMVKGVIPRGLQIDHQDHDGLNNRIDNLRLVTALENARNHPLRKDNASGVPGVTLDKASGKWRVRIGLNRKSLTLGTFAEKDEAKIVRRFAERVIGYHENHGRTSA
jgi:hypothetical protein